MRRKSSSRFVKPMLETLEARDQPSFIVSGALQTQLEPQVNGLLKDMQDAAGDLAKQVNSITTDNKTSDISLTPAQAQGFYGKAVADYQRIWNDQAAITTTVAVDTAFVNTVAMAEFAEGDPLDLLLLRFGSFIHLDPLTGFYDDLAQANQIWNNGQLTGNLTADINEDFSDLTLRPPYQDYYAGVIFTHQTIAQSAQMPTFA